MNRYVSPLVLVSEYRESPHWLTAYGNLKEQFNAQAILVAEEIKDSFKFSDIVDAEAIHVYIEDSNPISCTTFFNFLIPNEVGKTDPLLEIQVSPTIWFDQDQLLSVEAIKAHMLTIVHEAVLKDLYDLIEYLKNEE